MARIYTRSGDKGETGLLGGARVGKDAARVRAYGVVDELNAALGLAAALLGPAKPEAELLARIQPELFELGAELADPKGAPRIGATAIERLEREIDALESELPPLSSFIMPGGSPAGAALHLARCVCRRAERELVALARAEKVSAEAVRYLNRLSDHLFVAARAANRRDGAPEAPWRPGKPPQG